MSNFQDDSSQEEHDQCPDDLIDSILDIDGETERRVFLHVRLLFIVFLKIFI